MTVNLTSLANLDKGRVGKNAVRLNVTLKPETIALLKRTGNASSAIDKMVEYIKDKGLAQEVFF